MVTACPSQAVRHKGALVQYKESERFRQNMTELGDAQVELFHFSEHERLSRRKVDEPINAGEQIGEQVHASVLLTVTANSSYLYFDPVLSARNVDLCATLKEQLGGRIKFVLCPTSQSAIASLESHRNHVQQMCDDFLSAPAGVILWDGFDSRRSVNTDGVQSLIAEDDEEHDQPQSPRDKRPTCSQCSCGLGRILGLVIPCLFCFYGVHLWTLSWSVAHEEESLRRKNQTFLEQKKSEKAHLLKKHKALAEWSKKLDEKKQTLAGWSNRLDAKNQTLAEISKRLDKRNQTLAEWSTRPDKKHQTLAEMSKRLDEKNQTLAEMSKRLDTQDQSFAEMSKRLDKKNRTLAEMSKRLDEKNQTLAEMSKRLDKKNQSLAESGKRPDEKRASQEATNM